MNQIGNQNFIVGFMFDGDDLGNAWERLNGSEKHEAKINLFDFIVDKAHLDAKAVASRRDSIDKKV